MTQRAQSDKSSDQVKSGALAAPAVHHKRQQASRVLVRPGTLPPIDLPAGAPVRKRRRFRLRFGS